MEIDRIELADCGSPERLITEILRQNPDMPVPVPVEAIATAVGITEIHRHDMSGYEGGLITQPERVSGVILVSKSALPQRQRFTIGHELGHYLIMSHAPQRAEGFFCTKADLAMRSGSQDRARKMEIEANRFSAGLLMPLAKFKADMRDLGTPDLEHVIELASRYDTSREATALRYVVNHHVSCAVIVGKDGVVSKIYKPLKFPFLSASIGQPFPSGSLSSRSASSRRNDWADVDADVWFARDARYGHKLQEQFFCGGGPWTMTLLIDDRPDDELDDEEDGLPDAHEVWEAPSFSRRHRR